MNSSSHVTSLTCCLNAISALLIYITLVMFNTSSCFVKHNLAHPLLKLKCSNTECLVFFTMHFTKVTPINSINGTYTCTHFPDESNFKKQGALPGVFKNMAAYPTRKFFTYTVWSIFRDKNTII